MKTICDNCGDTQAESALRVKLCDIPSLSDRVEPGGKVPAGECGECGALCYPEAKRVR